MSPVPETPLRRPCPKCLIRDLPDEKELAEILRERIGQMPGEELADSALRESRLEICRGCASLHRGTCSECGCYVELRTARKKMACPHVPPYWK